MGFRAVVKKVIPKGLFPKVEPYGHLAEAVLFNALNGFPARGLKVVGVTGTAGKTTTVTLMASILRAAGYKTGYFTTVEHDFGKGPQFNATRMTTLGVKQLARDLKRLRANGTEWLVIEVASHSLSQHRVWGIPFKAAIFTNLHHEHLDYHGTFEAYRQAKQRLFKLTKRNGGVGIVNLDDAEAEHFVNLASSTVTYGVTSSAEVRATDVHTTADGSSFVVESKLAKPFKLDTKLPGTFNVNNVLAAASAALALGIEAEVITRGVTNLAMVPGRMARYKTSAGFTAVIDFAHTPDSFEKIFKEFRPLTKGKLIVVFGRAGERDVESRYVQGELAADYCDVIVLTEDDPRSEDNMKIIEQIKEGIAKSHKKPMVVVEPLREEAIDKAVELAGEGDVILLLAKGHERTIELADGPKPWNEEEALKAALKTHKIKLI